ncbi:MAG: nicotinate-nucleotide--dimethylbenzimidazole phosphoribosyltransferase [Proteobacteria bacterium]|nr:nicotinate-nucleotide--dimethylbenzimidazole phosphoribosyltransferase [Pseudomonadota bacterium]
MLTPQEAEASARERQRQLLKPLGSLGKLEALAIDLARIQRTRRPAARPAAVLLFASDHPVWKHEVSAYPQAATAMMMTAFASGGAACATLARALGLPLQVVDVGVAEAYSTPRGGSVVLRRESVADAETGDLRTEDAMSESVCAEAREAGRRAIDALGNEVHVLVLGEMGIANTTPAAALAAHVLGLPAEALVGPGTGLDAAGLERKRRVVADALARVAGTAADAALQRLGGREIAALVGAIERAAERRQTVLVDGFIVSAAALYAVTERPEVRDVLIFSHCSAEPGHARVLERLAASALLDLGLRLGEASGALTAFPLLELACRVHAEMWTFDDAARAVGGTGSER